MKKISLFLLTTPLLYAVYLSNKSCEECHPDIYREYQHSYHSKTFFNDELHRKVAKKAPVYDCGRCHMPAAGNLRDMEKGKTWPNPIHQRQKDAVSCFYCHQIAFVKKAQRFNQIVLAKQAEGYKPTLYGALNNPDDCDKHSSVKSPIYEKFVCAGCHSHKRNGNDVLIFRAMKENQGSEGCIKCHMPEIPGAPEKMNKRARMTHHSHFFNGIHDDAMRRKSVDISIRPERRKIIVTLHNKMGHPLIIQAARMKYLDLRLYRDGKVVWRNFKKDPMEDRKAVFVTNFLEHGKPSLIPYFATKRGFVNNLDANETRTLEYAVPEMKKRDRIEAAMYVILAKPECSAAIDLKERELTTPLLMKKAETTLR
ncbi:multiheme c-type cytochrome [Hydrogenimonas sp. SS33]|uniref:multiheme c-type cytochrome n=1 Tax=Hydrogenimonas leucolamina TaxID=2954236 RepID=UPI00336BC61B